MAAGKRVLRFCRLSDFREPQMRGKNRKNMFRASPRAPESTESRTRGGADDHAVMPDSGDPRVSAETFSQLRKMPAPWFALAALGLAAAVFASVSVWSAFSAAPPRTREISLADLRDKIEGGCAGQMIGVSYGAIALLSRSGLTAGNVSGRATGVPVATVPSAGTRVKRGSAVDIVLG